MSQLVTLLGLALIALLWSCSSNGLPSDAGDPDIDPITTGSWYRPSVKATWQWQLLGTLNQSYAVTVYDIDLLSTDRAVIAQLQKAGKKVICYFSAGTYESFRDEADQLPSAVLGKALPDFPDERWLDIRSLAVYRLIVNRLAVAAEKGCDGVEPDNVDAYDNESGFPLMQTHQLAFNRFIANEAHRKGLAVGLKNDVGQIDQLVDYFDFSVIEQCNEYDECAELSPFIVDGKPVFVAEYAEPYVTNAATRRAMCRESRQLNVRTLVLPIDLDDSFRFSCDDATE